MKLKTADKFILKSYLGPMFASFFIVMFILLMNVLWRYIDELVGKGLPLSIIAELLFYTTATLIPLGLPLATLFAAIMTLGNLGENYELLALKAAGISLPRIIRPITVMACLISVGSFFVMNNFVPYSYQKMGNILFDIRQMKQEIEFQDGVFFNGIPHVSIRVKKQDPKTKLLTDVLIYDTRSNNTVNTIVADSGYISLTKDKSLLKVRLFDGQSYEENRNYEWYERPKLRHYVFKYEEMVMPLEGFSFKRSDSSLFGDESEAKNITELGKDIDSLRVVADRKINDMVKLIFINHIVRNDTLEYYRPDSVELAAEKSYHFMLKEAFDTLSIDKKTNIMSNATSRLNDLKFFVSAEHDNVRSTTVKLYGSLSDWHKKLALPVSILIFFLIGAPLGAIIRKGGLGTPVVISVMFFVIYYVITIMGESLVNEGAWPPILGIWISSIVLFPIAIFLTYKSATDSQLLDMDSYTSAFKKFTRIFSGKKKKKSPEATAVSVINITGNQEYAGDASEESVHEETVAQKDDEHISENQDDVAEDAGDASEESVHEETVSEENGKLIFEHQDDGGEDAGDVSEESVHEETVAEENGEHIFEHQDDGGEDAGDISEKSVHEETVAGEDGEHISEHQDDGVEDAGDVSEESVREEIVAGEDVSEDAYYEHIDSSDAQSIEQTDIDDVYNDGEHKWREDEPVMFIGNTDMGDDGQADTNDNNWHEDELVVFADEIDFEGNQNDTEQGDKGWRADEPVVFDQSESIGREQPSEHRYDRQWHINEWLHNEELRKEEHINNGYFFDGGEIPEYVTEWYINDSFTNNNQLNDYKPDDYTQDKWYD